MLTLGANGQDGDIFIRDSTGSTTISCDGNSGKVVCKSLEQSDGRLKTDIAPLAGALENVLALRGYGTGAGAELRPSPPRRTARRKSALSARTWKESALSSSPPMLTVSSRSATPG